MSTTGALNPRPLVLCGPSGSGKSTLLKQLLQDFPDRFGFSVSHTTRKPRPGEKDGVHYFFIDKDRMQKSIKDGEFIENATFSGNIYGTSKAVVEAIKRQGKVCVLDIDVQGVKQVRETGLNPFYVFVKPPSLEMLEQRLRSRNTETEETLAQRLTIAQEEINYGESSGSFDAIVVNDNLEHAYKQLKGFITSNVLLNVNREGYHK